MADTGFNFPSTAAEDNTVGGVDWSNEANAKADDGSVASAYDMGGGGIDIYDDIVKLVKGGSVSGDNKANDAALSDTLSADTYGGSSDLWGLSLSPSDVNASNFGAVVSYTTDTMGTSYYLKVTDFGFSVPSGATIDGIEVVIEHRNFFDFDGDGANDAEVDYIKIKVYYTESGGGAVASQTIIIT